MRALEFVTESVPPRNIAGNLQVGNYWIKIDQHLLDRLEDRTVIGDEAISTINKIGKAKAKIKEFVPGEKFYLHDNSNGLYILFRTIDSDKKVYLAKTVWTQPKISSRVPIVEVP